MSLELWAEDAGRRRRRGSRGRCASAAGGVMWRGGPMVIVVGLVVVMMVMMKAWHREDPAHILQEGAGRATAWRRGRGGGEVGVV